LNGSWIVRILSILDEGAPIFPLCAAAILTLGPILQQLMKLGQWFQTVGVILTALLCVGYVGTVTFALGGWYGQLRTEKIDVKNISEALVVARKILINRAFMLALLPVFVLAEIYLHTTTLHNLDLRALFIGEFFMVSFVPYFGVYLFVYLTYQSKPLLGATLYFAAAAAENNLRSTMRLADSATSYLSRAVTKNTGLLRIKEGGPLLTYLFHNADDKAAILLRLARSCGDASAALGTLASVTHTSVESLLELATLRRRILDAPWDLILGVLVILIELFFRFMTSR
jgi:hypothetical protein